jgi:hypothetical protein
MGHNTSLSHVRVHFHVLVVYNLLNGVYGLLGKRFIFEEERQLFKCAATSLWVEHVDEQSFESDPAAIDGEEFPVAKESVNV